MSQVKLTADSGGGSIAFKAPSSTTSNADVQLTLPVDDGTANQVLTTNGSGALSWAAPVIADDSIVEAKLDIHNAPSGTDKFLGYTSNGMEWATAGGGKLLQAVEANYSTSVATTSASMVDTGLTCTINNVASGSKILVIVNQAMRQYRDRNSTNKMGFGVDLVRTPDGGAATIILASRKNDNNNYMDFYFDGDAKNDVSVRHPMVKLDTPGVTGTIVYKTMMASGKGSDDSAQVWAQGDWESQTTSPTSTITLLEIGS